MINDLDWKQAENITALIERAISPDAHVQANVYLSVIGTKRSRQCDVVIYFGKPPRQTIAIVEVQKRKRKPDITTFHGWVRKMQEVGAQQLFCVSALGYPKSIIDDVQTRIGPTVKLLTLEDLTSVGKVSAFMLAPFIVETSPQYLITDFGIPKVIHEVSFNFNTDERIISIGDSHEMFSLNEIIANALNNASNLQLPPPHEMDNWNQFVILPLESGTESIYFNLANKKIQVKEWSIGLKLFYAEIKHIPIPVTHLEYKQELWDGTIAWVAHTQFNYKGQNMELTVIVRPDEQGYLRNVITRFTQL